MRQKLKNILRGDGGFLSLGTRERLGVTQEKMREMLNRGEGSSSDIETDRNHRGSLIAMLLSGKQDTLRHSREVLTA
ncbi:MAG: hypothetical protein IIW82_02250 [Clostridia bacterium]|nr:hypothetical protein [Clostridia bacterium]